MWYPDCPRLFLVSRLCFSGCSKSFVLLNISIECHGRGLHYLSQKVFDMPSSRLCFVGHAPNIVQRVGTHGLISRLYSGTMPLRFLLGRRILHREVKVPFQSLNFSYIQREYFLVFHITNHSHTNIGNLIFCP